MAFWNRKKAEPEQRATVEDPTVPISSANILDFWARQAEPVHPALTSLSKRPWAFLPYGRL